MIDNYSNSVEVRNELVELAKAINSKHIACSNSMRKSLTEYRSLGVMLLDAKKRFGKHGDWKKWIEKNLKFKYTMITMYMRVARNWEKVKSIGDSRSMRSALLLISKKRSTKSSPHSEKKSPSSEKSKSEKENKPRAPRSGPTRIEEVYSPEDDELDSVLSNDEEESEEETTEDRLDIFVAHLKDFVKKGISERRRDRELLKEEFEEILSAE